MSAAVAPAGTAVRSAKRAQPEGSAIRHFLRSGVTYWGAMLAVGACNLGFSLIAARRLGPSAYGALAAIVALVNVFLIAASAITRTVTVVVATADDRATGASIFRRGTVAAAGAGVVAMFLVGLAAAPVAHALHMQDPVWIWIAAASLVPAFAGAVTTGILQGLRLFRASGGVNLTAAVLKLITLLLLLDAGLGVAGAGMATLAEVTLIWLVAIPLLHRMFRGVRETPARAGAARHGSLALPAALTVARLVFFNLDILVARHYLGPEDAGLFAALAVTGRIIAYGTGALPPVVYPYLVRHRGDAGLMTRYLALCLAATAVAGGGAIAVLGLAPVSVVRVLFDSAFSGIAPYVAWYGLAFLLYSLSYVLLHYLLAVENWWVWVYAVGGGLAEVGALAVFHGGIGRLTAVETVFFGILFILTSAQTAVGLRRQRRAAAASTAA